MNYYYNLPQDLQNKIYLYNVRQAKENLHAELLGVLKDFGWERGDGRGEPDVWEYVGIFNSINPRVGLIYRNNLKNIIFKSIDLIDAPIAMENGLSWDYSKYATLILYYYDICCEHEDRTKMVRGEF